MHNSRVSGVIPISYLDCASHWEFAMGLISMIFVDKENNWQPNAVDIMLSNWLNNQTSISSRDAKKRMEHID